MDRSRRYQTRPPCDLNDKEASAQVLPKNNSTLGVSVSPCNFLVAGYVCTCPRCIACKEGETKEWLKQASQENLSEDEAYQCKTPLGRKLQEARKAIVDAGLANMSEDDIIKEIDLQRGRGDDDAV